MRREGAWVTIVYILHVRRREHAVHLARKVAPANREMGFSRYERGTDSQKAGRREEAGGGE